MATGGRHQRRPTFDSATIFEDYTKLFDEETRELLRKDNASNNSRISISASNNVSDLKNGMYQPPMVNDSEKALIMEQTGSMNKNKTDHVATNSYFKQWHTSRRRTLDELESRGVLNPNLFNLMNKNKRNNMLKSKALEMNDLSMIASVENEVDDLEEMELNKNDLYYIHCHQVSRKQNKKDNIFTVKKRKSNIVHLSICNTAPSAPPPTAVHTPLSTSQYTVHKMGFDRMQKVVKSKLERHSARLEREEMVNMLHNTKDDDEDDDDDDDLDEDDNDADAQGNDNGQVRNAFNISYSSIPFHIDGGILSSWMFLSYKEWIESRIISYTESAGKCLDEMKKESNALEKLHRDTVHKSRHNMLYDGVDMDVDASGSRAHLTKLSQIDANLADIGDGIAGMVKVQKHVLFLSSQYDTYMDGLRSDQCELLWLICELRDRIRECSSILAALNACEVWLITNIANIMAVQSESIDSLKRRMSDIDIESEESAAYNARVRTTKQFIDELNVLIQELSQISDNKRREISRLKQCLVWHKEENAKLISCCESSYSKVRQRLDELETHYSLPQTSLQTSLNCYLQKETLNCANYYNRSLDAFESQFIYSSQCLRRFYLQFVLLINNVFIDCILLHEYCETNDKDKDKDKENEAAQKHYKQSSTALLNDVFTPITRQETHCNSFLITKDGDRDGNTLLNHVLDNNELNMQFESIHFIQNMNKSIAKHSLQKKIKIISLFAHCLCFRETIVNIVARAITIKYRKEIQATKYVQNEATKYVRILIQNILKTNCTRKSIQKVGQKNQKNVHKIAALILKSVYNIDIPFPIAI